jgi:hypothetical protein
METPSIEIFNDMKQAATQVWETYDNEYGYVDEKLNYVNGLNNIQDNAMVFYRMFDWENQRKFKQLVNEETLEYIKNNQ